MRPRFDRPAIAIATAALLVALAFRPYPVAAADTVCPFEIAVTQNLAGSVEGWTAGADPWPTELANLSVFDGPPEELADLIYDDEIEDAETWTTIWELWTDNPRGFWIRCRYANTLVTIERKLPTETTRCEVVFEKLMSYADGRPVVRSMRCS